MMNLFKSKIVVPKHQKQLINKLAEQFSDENHESIAEHIIDNGVIMHHLASMSDEEVIKILNIQRMDKNYMEMSKTLTEWWDDGSELKSKEQLIREKYGR